MLNQEIQQSEVTDNTDFKPDNDLKNTFDYYDGKVWYQSLIRFLKLLNTFFQLPRTYQLSHVNDDTDIISRSDSDRRVFLLIWFLGFCLDLGMTILISILISIINNDALDLRNNLLQNNSDVPVVKKLVVIFGDGTTLLLAMTKSLELEIVKTHRFNFDKCGFFAYDHVDHIQTLVGSPGKLNYIHDSNFNSKKIIGNLFLM